MTGERFLLGIGFVLALAGGLLVIVVHLNFVVLPLTAMVLGLIGYMVNPSAALRGLIFAIPWTAALPALDPNGYPFNYMGIPLFLAAGMILASMAKRERLNARHPVAFMATAWITITAISVFFLLLRWSNLTLAGHAFLQDTPVTPDGQRISFAVVFPVITMMITAVSPHIFLMLRRHALSRKKALNSLFCGYFVSLGIAATQRFLAPGFLSRGYFIHHHQLNGGASDFNAFGFLSGFVFLAALLHFARSKPGNMARTIGATMRPLGIMTASLAGLILSGSRTGFLFVIAGGIVVLTSRRWRLKTRVLLLSGCILLLAISGGVLRNRIAHTLTLFQESLQSDGIVSALDRASNQRITMLSSGIQLVGSAPVTGVGAGNFLFALKNLYYGREHLEDLPLNQYLLAASETGILGLVVFLGLLWIMARKPRHETWRPLLWTILAAFFVGTPLWLPELALLFWFTAWLLDPESPRNPPAKGKILLAAVILALLFGLGSVWEFKRLHPLNWCRDKQAPYTYGLWNPDTAADGEVFSWTHHAAGVYLDPGSRRDIRVIAEAPFRKFPGGIQKIKVFWRGKNIRNYRTDTRREWWLKMHSSRGGFLEFRIDPPFNLRDMGLGPEGRTLGVQLHGLEP